MHCEARTSTGLGCDSLGIQQCPKCWLIDLNIDTVIQIEDAWEVIQQDAWVLGCIKNCKQGPDCPCLPYRMGDVPPRYSVPAKLDAPMIIYTRWYWLDEELVEYNRLYNNYYLVGDAPPRYPVPATLDLLPQSYYNMLLDQDEPMLTAFYVDWCNNEAEWLLQTH